MIKYFLALILIGMISSSFLFAQSEKDFPALTVKDIPGGTIARESTFDGNSLWGQIDGGADVYLEYGFDQLLFQEVKWNRNTFRVEFYKMVDAETAFGIFSISTHKCTQQDTLTKWICITSFQVQAAIGRYYISIANDTGSKEAEKLTVDLLQKILPKQNEKLFELPSSFSNQLVIKNLTSIKFVKGDLGLQNGFPSWQEMFTRFSGYKIFILPIYNDQLYSYIAKVEFKSVEDAARFINSIGIKYETTKKYLSSPVGKELREIKMISDKEFYYCATNEGKSVLEKF